jgi:uncharacterized protein
MRPRVAEKLVQIPAGALCLEGRLEDRPGDAAVALAPPHPLYGGTMNDAVIDALRLAYRDRGYSTLRFNYRGVGRSQGTPTATAAPAPISRAPSPSWPA